MQQFHIHIIIIALALHTKWIVERKSSKRKTILRTKISLTHSKRSNIANYFPINFLFALGMDAALICLSLQFYCSYSMCWYEAECVIGKHIKCILVIIAIKYVLWPNNMNNEYHFDFCSSAVIFSIFFQFHLTLYCCVVMVDTVWYLTLIIGWYHFVSKHND